METELGGGCQTQIWQQKKAESDDCSLPCFRQSLFFVTNLRGLHYSSLGKCLAIVMPRRVAEGLSLKGFAAEPHPMELFVADDAAICLSL